jgi:hypothetical protein
MPYKTAAMVLNSVATTATRVLLALNSGFINPMIASGVERRLLASLMAVALFIPEGLLNSPRIRPWKRD